MPQADGPDFDLAEEFMRQAREAHKNGDKTRCTAAIKMVQLALQFKELTPEK